MSKDSLHRFLFENTAVRGELIHLDATVQAVFERHDYPAPLQRLLGEMMSAVMLLIATLKFKGKLIAQVQGKGPVSLLVVEGSHDRTLRAIAHHNGEVPEGDLVDMLGDAHLVITIEQENGERYQGIVEVSGNNLSDALTDYLMRSEQLESRLWLTATNNAAAGLLIQKLPDDSGDVETWNRIQHLSSTITDQELEQLDAMEIIHRLFHEEDVRIFESEPVAFRCGCSHERVETMLRSLGSEELHSIIEDEGRIEVACEFCNRKYLFDAVDVEQLLKSEMSIVGPETLH